MGLVCEIKKTRFLKRNVIMENGASGSSSPFQIQARLLAGEI